MHMVESGDRLIIQGSPTVKDTALYLGVGIVFIGAGAFLMSSAGGIGIVFFGLGVVALLMFAHETRKTAKVYTFDRSTQQLRVSDGSTLPLSEVTALVKEDTWKGSYGESHRSHQVSIHAAGHGSFNLPANSAQEAHRVVNTIKRYTRSPSSS